MQADLPNEFNFKNSIYIKNMDEIIYSNTTSTEFNETDTSKNNSIGERSESERVYLWPGAYKYRPDYTGEMTVKLHSFDPNSDGKWDFLYKKYTDVSWSIFVVNQMYRED